MTGLILPVGDGARLPGLSLELAMTITITRELAETVLNALSEAAVELANLEGPDYVIVKRIRAAMREFQGAVTRQEECNEVHG